MSSISLSQTCKHIHESIKNLHQQRNKERNARVQQMRHARSLAHYCDHQASGTFTSFGTKNENPLQESTDVGDRERILKSLENKYNERVTRTKNTQHQKKQLRPIVL